MQGKKLDWGNAVQVMHHKKESVPVSCSCAKSTCRVEVDGVDWRRANHGSNSWLGVNATVAMASEADRLGKWVTLAGAQGLGWDN